jgi:hypothetical protein
MGIEVRKAAIQHYKQELEGKSIICLTKNKLYGEEYYEQV